MKTLKFLIIFCFIQSMCYAQITITAIGLTGGCSGSCEGVATFSVTGGLAPYSYSISPSSGSVYYNNAELIQCYNLCQGQYTLTVVDQNSLTATTTFSIIQSPLLSAVVTTTNPGCNGACNGKININISGGIPPYSYYSSPAGGITTPTAMPMTNLCPDIYVFGIQDSNGCLIFDSVPLVPNTNLSGVTTSLSIINEICNYSGDGAINLNLSGTNPGPFTYNWSNGATTQNTANLASGIYFVTIIDATMNCRTLFGTVSMDSTNCGSIWGNLYLDNNSDCVKNNGDADFSHSLIVANPGNRYAYPDSFGNYSFRNISYGSYSLTSISTAGVFTPTCTSILSTTINSSVSSSWGNNFAFKSNGASQPDLLVSAYNNGIVPGFNSQVNYYLHNLSLVNTNGVYKVQLPSAIISNITSVSPTNYILSGDTIIWNYANADYFSPLIFIVKFNVPLNISLGSVFTTCMYATSTLPDFDLTNNQYCYDRIVTGAFDPNDKSVSPVGDGPNGNITVNDKELSYLVRFQNTGNGPANTVIVKDSISPFLDMTTFQMISSSHNYDLEIAAGNIIKWNFNSIMLPDSTSDEPGSHGYIHYKIKQKANNPIGSKIKNTAYIYFDFNEAVVTNSTLNTIVAPTGFNEVFENKDSWQLFPNPSNGLVYLENNSEEGRVKSEIQVINSMGQMVYKEEIEASNETLDLNRYNPGVYFVRIVSDKQTVVKRFVLNK